MEDKEIRYELNRLSVQIGELQQDIKVVATALLEQQKYGQLHPDVIKELTRIGK